MTNLLALLNLVSIISSSPTIQFSVLLNHGSSSDIFLPMKTILLIGMVTKII